MQSNKLYSDGQQCLTANDRTKVVNGAYRGSRGYVNIGEIYIQWGSFSISANNRGSQNFMTAFNGTPWSAVCTWDYDNTGGQENYAITSITSTTIYITNGEGTTRLFRWIAIGPA